MSPPWLEYPDVPQGMGWRMGVGQAYSETFADWFAELDSTGPADFMTDFPEPENWSGFYANIIEYMKR